MSRQHGLGLLRPPDNRHRALFGFTPQAPPPPGSVERIFDYPHNLIDPYDQHQTEACVAFSLSWLMSIFNGRSYAPPRLWLECKRKDGLGNPNANRGTFLRTGCDILRTEGHWRVIGGKAAAKPDPAEGIASNLWAASLQDVRACFAQKQPGTLAIDWYSGYDDPGERNGERWIDPARRGAYEGGHAITAIGCSDRRQGVLLLNSWGGSWSPTWMPYAEVTWQLARGGEFALVTDKPSL